MSLHIGLSGTVRSRLAWSRICPACAGCGYGGADLQGVAWQCAQCSGEGMVRRPGWTIRTVRNAGRTR